MEQHFLLIISSLIHLASSQLINPTQDNDGNDVDNDQTAAIDAFGNVITPIKGNVLKKKNNGNQVYHIYTKKKKQHAEVGGDSANLGNRKKYHYIYSLYLVVWWNIIWVFK